jgi:hypothetical protein
VVLDSVADDPIDVDGSYTAVEPTDDSSRPPDHREHLHRLFEYQNEHIRLQDSRISAVSKADFVERLACLFLFAHELEGTEAVPRAALNKILSESGVFDGNARGWIARTPLLIRDDANSLVKLTVPGREKAKESLDRITNKSPETTWELGSTPRRRKSKSATTEPAAAKDASKSSKRSTANSSKQAVQWADLWRERASKLINAFEILEHLGIAEKGLFALWAIRRLTNDDVKIVSRHHLSQFLEQAFELKVSGPGLENALKTSDIAKGRVINTGGSTSFQINAGGVKYIESLIGGNVQKVKWNAPANEKAKSPS